MVWFHSTVTSRKTGDLARSTSERQGAPRCNLPRKLLQRLLFDHEITAGCRVLEIGGGETSLSAFLEYLGIDVQAAEHSQERAALLRQVSPTVECHLLSDLSTAPWTGFQFDAILVRELSAWHENLFAPAAFAATGRLLTSLRPGGSLIYFERFASGHDTSSDGHTIACYARHLSYFPGACRVMRVRDHWSWGALRAKILYRQPRATYKLTSVQIPAEAIGRKQWQQLSEQPDVPEHATCCDGAERSLQRNPAQRRAA